MEPARVLIVDDDVHMLEFISAVVGNLGHETTACRNFELAFLALADTSFDLVIADLFMEGMGGIEGIQQLKKLQPELQIVAISGGYADMPDSSALRASEMIGADAALAKPINIGDLTMVVEQFLPNNN